MSKVILMDFSADWCGPCKLQDPIIEELKEKFRDSVEFRKIDVDANQELSLKYQIHAVPTLVIVQTGKMHLFNWDQIPGNDDEKLKEFLIKNFDIKWISSAKFEKDSDEMTINSSSGKNSLSLRLNDEKTKVDLMINEATVNEFIVKVENGTLNIYGDLIKKYVGVTRGNVLEADLNEALK